MIDILINISKIGIRSIFTAKKYDTEILDEDLRRILFIRNYLEESLQFVKETYKDVDAKVYSNEQNLFDGCYIKHRKSRRNATRVSRIRSS